MLDSAADSSVVEDRPSDSEKIAHETSTDTNAPTQWRQIAILLALYLVMFAVALVLFLFLCFKAVNYTKEKLMC